MNPILIPKAGQLHAEKVDNRSDKQAVNGKHFGKPGNRFGIFGTYPLPDADKMHGSSCGWVFSIDEHVDAGGMTEFQAKRLDNLGDFFYVLAADRRVYVSCQARSERVNLVHMQVDG